MTLLLELAENARLLELTENEKFSSMADARKAANGQKDDWLADDSDHNYVVRKRDDGKGYDLVKSRMSSKSYGKKSDPGPKVVDSFIVK